MNSKHRYYVEYYDDVYARAEYQKYIKDKNLKISFKEYLQGHDGYNWSFQHSDYFFNLKNAKKHAAHLSFKYKDLALVRREYPIIIENKIDWEFDEGFYPYEYSNGELI